MIVIGEDLPEPAQRLKKLFEDAGVPPDSIKIVSYLRPGGGGTHYTEGEMARKFDSLATGAGERTAFVIDLSPQMFTAKIDWGLRVLGEFAHDLHGGAQPENVYQLLADDNFLFVLRTMHDLTRDLLTGVLSVDLSRIDYWESVNRRQWEGADIPRRRPKPLLMYVRQLADDPRMVSKVVAWLNAMDGGLRE